MNEELVSKALIHVYLVSDQATPNILPAYDQRLKPEVVYLVHSPDDQGFATGLKNVLQPLGIQINFWPVSDAWNKDHIQFRLLELFEVLGVKSDECKIALNLSGGNQLSCVAAFETFRAYHQAIFHIQPETDELTWLHPADYESFNLQDSIRLEAFLLAYGVMLKSNPVRNVPDAGQLTLAKSILMDLDRFSDALPTFNYLAKSAEGNLVSDPVTHENSTLLDLIDLFEQAGKVAVNNKRLHFADEESRFFANGGWIELYVFDVIRQCRKQYPQIQDIAYSLNVYRDLNGHAVPNEIDVAFLCNNRLYLIECKTMVFKSSKRQRSGTNTLYKLDTLRTLLGGVQAKSMLVSFMQLPKHDWQRARDLNIDVCAGSQLLNLKDYVLRFIANPTDQV